MNELDRILIKTHSDVILEECPKLISANEMESKSSLLCTGFCSIVTSRAHGNVSFNGSHSQWSGSNVKVFRVSYC